MPAVISVISALALLLTGAWLLHDGVLARDPLHLQIEIIAGATLLSAVVVCSVLLLRDWIKWKRELAKYRES
jgi:CHASE2 domain-containing sensor protein